MHCARRAVEVGLALIMLENGLLVLSCTSMTNNTDLISIRQVKTNMLASVKEHLVVILL